MSSRGGGDVGVKTVLSRVRAVEVPCVLNIAAVKLRFKEYDEAIHECNKVLGIEVRLSIKEQTAPFHNILEPWLCQKALKSTSAY